MPPGSPWVGDRDGEGAAQERGVVGETPNLPLRLQAPMATPTPNGWLIGRSDPPAESASYWIGKSRAGKQTCRALPSRKRALGVLGESGEVKPGFEGLALGEEVGSSGCGRGKIEVCAAALGAGKRRRKGDG